MWSQIKHPSIASPITSRRMQHLPMNITRDARDSRDTRDHYRDHMHHHHVSNHASRDESVMNCVASQFNVKFVKPSQPIYRPPSARGHESHVNGERSESPDSSSTSTSLSNNELNVKRMNIDTVTVCPPLKSALKRSKSFGSKAQESYDNMIALDGVSWESVTQVRRAIESSEPLTMTQLMPVVRIVCNKALEKSCNAHPMANICFTIMNKQKHLINHFIESLINCLREWFNERDKLRVTTGGTRRWTAYVAFVTELYLNMRMRSREFTIDDVTMCTVTGHGSLIDKQRRQFSTLLYDSCQTILSFGNASPAEIECLQSVLRSCGKYLEEDNAIRMRALIMMVREMFFLSQLKCNQLTSQKSLLEIIEFAASKWQFNQSQLIYYFPYTKME